MKRFRLDKIGDNTATNNSPLMEMVTVIRGEEEKTETYTKMYRNGNGKYGGDVC